MKNIQPPRELLSKILQETTQAESSPNEQGSTASPFFTFLHRPIGGADFLKIQYAIPVFLIFLLMLGTGYMVLGREERVSGLTTLDSASAPALMKTNDFSDVQGVAESASLVIEEDPFNSLAIQEELSAVGIEREEVDRKNLTFWRRDVLNFIDEDFSLALKKADDRAMRMTTVLEKMKEGGRDIEVVKDSLTHAHNLISEIREEVRVSKILITSKTFSLRDIDKAEEHIDQMNRELKQVNEIFVRIANVLEGK